MVEVMKIMATSFKRSHALLHSVPLTLKQATVNPSLHQRLLDTPRQVWASLLWGHCSFLLGPGAYKVLFVPAKSLFPQSCVSSGGTMVGLMATSSKRAYAIHTQVYCTQSSCPCGWPVLARTFAGDTHTQLWLSLSLCSISGSWCAQGVFEPSECLWCIRGLILNTISPLLPSCWGFSFALGHGVSFFGGIQHSPVDGCSAVSCSFGVLAGEDEHTPFYCAILHPWKECNPKEFPIPKKSNAKECSNYHTITVISHASKVMLKILQARLQQYVNHELPDVQAGFRKGRGTRDQIANIHWIIEKAREFQKNNLFLLY